VEIMAMRLAVIAGLLLVGGAALTAQTPATPIPENYYAAGEHVGLPAPVLGDAVIAGRIVTIGQEVSGDVLAAGWRVQVVAPTADDVRIAGAEVEVKAAIGGDLTAAAGDLMVSPGTRVSGRSWLTGGTVRADGIFDREVRIAADRVQIGGEIREPIRVVAQRLEILSTARVLGPLTYEGATQATVAAGAVLERPITYKQIPAKDVRDARWPRGLTSVVFGIHVFFGGLLLLLLLPRFAAKPADALLAAPGQSLLAGLALLVTIPFVAVLLMISVVGLPAGLVVTAAYVAALFIGVVTTAMFVGSLEARMLNLAPASTRRERLMLLLAGVLTLAVLRSIPVLGTIVVFASIVAGLGAVGSWMYRAYLQVPAVAVAQ
jgi:cytoskeletal protein CcmA (bactofilin family)